MYPKVHVPTIFKMRDKSKANFACQLNPESLKIFKQLCNSENLSQSKMLELMIDDWGTISEPVKITATMPIKLTPAKIVSKPKESGREPTMAELLKEMINQK